MPGGVKNIFECVVPSIEGIQGSLHYFATECEISIEGTKAIVYGIRVEKRHADCVEEAEEYCDITTRYDDIIRLTELLYRNSVTPVSVFNVIEDYIA